MPGTQTKDFDAVLEVSEEAVNKLLHTFFDSGGLISTLTNLLGLGSVNGAFSLSALLDKPTDLILPNAQNVIDLRFDIGTPTLLRFRVVAEIRVDRSNPDFDIPRIDFSKPFKLQVLFQSIPIPLIDSVISGWLKNSVGFIPLIPFPVKRDSTDPIGLPMQADFKIVDDVRNAIAYALTFAGGQPGNLDALTDFIPNEPNKTGTIEIAFKYLARVLMSKLPDALGAKKSDFAVSNDTIRLVHELSVGSGDQSATMDKLDIVLRDGRIEVEAHVKKSGFCYDATGLVKGNLKLGVRDGNIIFESHFDNPEVHVNIPWYCYVVGALVGIVAGGIIGLLVGAIFGGAAVGGIIGAIVGGILIPTIMAITQGVVNKVIEAVTHSLTNALNQSFSIPAVGLNIVFQDAFIDDVGVHLNLQPVEQVQIRASGQLLIPNGAFVDLDNGKIGNGEMGGMDLVWSGDWLNRYFKTRCGASLARLNPYSFDRTLRWELYHLQYANTIVPLSEFARFNPFGSWFGSENDKYEEWKMAYAVMTAEGRYAIFEVSQVYDHAVLIRYRTYEKNLPHLRIDGGFRCEKPPLVSSWKSDAVVHFEPAAWLATNKTINMVNAARTSSAATLQTPNHDHDSQAKMAASSLVSQLHSPAFDATIGEFSTNIVVNRNPVGYFYAKANGLDKKVQYHWRIAGQALKAKKGSLKVLSRTVKYSHQGNALVVEVLGKGDLEFLIEVTAIDNSNQLTASKCATYVSKCEERVPVVVRLGEYLQKYSENFGIVRVPTQTANLG